MDYRNKKSMAVITLPNSVIKIAQRAIKRIHQPVPGYTELTFSETPETISGFVGYNNDTNTVLLLPEPPRIKLILE